MHTDISNPLRKQADRNKNHQRYQQTPKRTRIQLKRHRQNKIPEVQIKLDDMLTQAYSEIRTQSKRNTKYSEWKQPQLDNSFLKQYIYHIYGQYNIPDPATCQELFSNNRHIITQNQDNQKMLTPKKTGNYETQHFDTPSGIRKSRSRTMDKISRMKRNFQEQLGNNTTEKNFQTRIDTKISLSQFHNEKSIGRSFTSVESLEERKFPIKKTKKLKIRIVSQKNIRNQVRKTSYLLSKCKYHYCLMCEQPLEENFITKHEKDCPELQKLLTRKVLNKNQIIHLLNIKIDNLEKKILDQVSHIKGDALKIEVKIQNMIQRKNYVKRNPGDQVSIEDERDQINEYISQLGFIKCWQEMDKLQWFKLLRARAKSEIPLVNFSL